MGTVRLDVLIPAHDRAAKLVGMIADDEAPGSIYRTSSLITTSRSAGSPADWDLAFDAELRLRFFKGFVWTRVAH